MTRLNKILLLKQLLLTIPIVGLIYFIFILAVNANYPLLDDNDNLNTKLIESAAFIQSISAILLMYFLFMI